MRGDRHLLGDWLSELLEAAADLVTVFDPSGALLHVNRVAARYLGIPAYAADVGHHDLGPDVDPALDGRTVFELFDRPSADRIRFEALPALDHQGTWRGEATLSGTRTGIPTSLVLIAHRGPAGIERYSGIARDVTELKDVQRALMMEATHDALTQLPNRGLLLDRLEHAVSRAGRSGAELAVLYIDLDRVKVVNDSLGHYAGDRLLVQVAQRLRDGLRSPDTVGRLGGDEFVVIAEDLDGPRDGVELARRIVDDMARPFDLDGVEAFVSASVGVAFLSGPEDSADTLLRDADVAMYRAKSASGNRYEIFDNAMRAWATERFEMEAALRHAIERHELDVEYQPQVRAGTAELVGFEALARWTRPTGIVTPDVFIPLAEETGLVAGIDARVLEQACAQAVEWNARRAVLSAPPLRLGVNISSRQLTQPGVRDVVDRVIGETGLEPSWLTIEVTESALVRDPAAARLRLEGLKDLGVRIALDDFGTGYSSLAYLQKFPLDSVKIDQLFVRELDVTARDRNTTIVASMVALAHELGFEVVAEGVRSTSQLEVLTELGCDIVQGNAVSAPLTAGAAGTWASETQPSMSPTPGR